MKPPIWMAVGGFILALGTVLIVGGFIDGLSPPATPNMAGNATSGAFNWYGPNLVIVGTTISPNGGVILVYGIYGFESAKGD